MSNRKSRKLKNLLLLLSVFLVFIIVTNYTNSRNASNSARQQDSDQIVVEDEAEEFGELRWPKSDIATLLSVPISNIGKVEWETSYGFVIYVGETSKEEFNIYIDDCWERGFTRDYSRGDDYFWANNENYYKVTVRHEDGNIMWIRIDAPKTMKNSESTSSDEPASQNQTPEPAITEEIDEQTTNTTIDEANEDFEAYFDAMEALIDISDGVIISMRPAWRPGNRGDDYSIIYITVSNAWYSSTEEQKESFVETIEKSIERISQETGVSDFVTLYFDDIQDRRVAEPRIRGGYNILR
jgi:hypothetical protein